MISYLLFLHPRSRVAPDLFDNRTVVGIHESQHDLYHAVGRQTPEEIVGEGPDLEAPEWQVDAYENAREPHVWKEETNHEKPEGIYEYQIIHCSVEQLRKVLTQQ